MANDKTLDYLDAATYAAYIDSEIKKDPRSKFDPVKRPKHYADTKIECIDYILDKGLDFPLGNAVKYITRAGKKHSASLDDTEKTIQDLEKAKTYIDFEIDHLKGIR